MVNTYKIREVTVTIPKIGIVSSDKEGNEFKCGEIYHINLFAMRPGWQTKTSDFDGLIVGRLDFSGYTESPYSRTQKIIMPNGYELVALRVGECGRPMTWESLPVVFSDAPLSDSEPLTVKNGEVFIKEVVIGDGIVSARYNMKFNINNDGKEHAAGMTVGVEDGQSNVEFMADRYTVHEAASSIIENAVATSAKTKIRLGDEMKQAVIDAVRESDLFASLRANVDAQTASIVGLQQAVHDAVNDALRNALKPGGAVWARMKHGF
ncbi:phage tail tip fiber protein [Enterobacter hormaechei]